MHLRATSLAALTLLAAATGCHSHYIEADITNSTATPLTLVELDYPSASFGTEALPAGATYHYRFKILGDGPTKLLWTDASRHDHTVAGPQLREGQEGSLAVTITDGAPDWNLHLHP
jgi:hypothetical protein